MGVCIVQVNVLFVFFMDMNVLASAPRPTSAPRPVARPSEAIPSGARRKIRHALTRGNVAMVEIGQRERCRSLRQDRAMIKMQLHMRRH